MEGGKLHVDMLTRTGVFWRVKTDHSYADGNWWEVTVLRINDFLAILVPEKRDYRNNDRDSTNETSIDLASPLHVGGTDSDTSFLPIREGFTGCIRLLEISTPQQDDTDTYEFDLGNPDDQYNVGKCYEAIRLGTAFNGTGYATIEDQFVLTSNLDVSVRFSTVQRSFLLLLLYQDAESYFLMDAEDGRIRVHLRKNNVTTTILTARVETGYEICDGEFHTVVFSANRFQQTGLDDISVIGKLQVGGVPDAASLASPDLTQPSFQGCLESLVFNGVTQDFRQTALTEHVTSGCPARP
ncbi:laminin subunit alpha-1-like [Branchiostoma lanceolatum]|uniref:laminin subunit alpha-1-like n=1 Tax=Branchiostoma lanceolatum TaxID=7740 RepID=UPI003456CDF1